MNKNNYIYAALGFVLIVTQVGRAQSTKGDARIQTTPVTVVKATAQTLIETTTVRGQIETATKPNVAAKVDAEVTHIYLTEGDSVKQGQVLAELDNEAFIIDRETASADITYLNVLIENEARLLKRNQDLFKKKMISQAVLDDSETLLKQSHAKLLSAKAKLRKALYKLSHTKIISPINGVVQTRMISKGDYVKTGDDLYYLISTNDIYARLYFPDTVSDQVQLNMSAILIHQQRGQTEKVSGTIERIRPMLEKGTRALHALVNFSNDFHWKIGTSIQAKVIFSQHKNAITVPKQALVHRPHGLVVYKTLDKNKVVEQVVTSGLSQGNTIEILSGLSLNDEIVLEGAVWLTDGALIDIVEP